MSLLNQKTIKNSVQFNGVGLHSGKVVNLSINPSEPDSGIVFKRVDLKDNNTAHVNLVNFEDGISTTKIINAIKQDD